MRFWVQFPAGGERRGRKAEEGGEGEGEGQEREGKVDGVMDLQDTVQPGFPATSRSWEEARNNFLLQPERGHQGL